MNILLVSDTYYPHVNGASYFTYRLANALAARGHRVSVVTPASSWKDTQTSENGVTVYRVRSLMIPGQAVYRWLPLSTARGALRQCVREVRPDVIHIQNHFMMGKAAVDVAREERLPVVGTNHFMPENLVHFLHLPRRLERIIILWAWKWFSQIYRQVDCVTTPTKTAADLLRHVGFRKEVLAISCGIDATLFHPHYEQVHRDRPVVLYVGRLEREKRLPVVLDAFAMVLRERKAHLMLVGVGNCRDALERQVVRLGIRKDVTFTGFVADVLLPDLYRKADVFVMASVAELQSIATMEAMASGLPVIAADAMALPELVHDGENGYLFPPDDASALAERLNRVLDDPTLRARMGKESLNIIRVHRPEQTVAQFEEVYRSVTVQGQR